MIHPDTIQQLKDLSLVDVITRYNDITLKKSGTHNFVGKSPWSNEKTPSFYVIPAKGIFNDFSTGRKGNNPISFVMQKENLDFVDACKSLASQHGIEIKYTKEEKQDPEVVKKKIAVSEALEWACAHFIEQPVPEPFRKQRALPDAILNAFKVGFAKPLWDDLLSAAKVAGIDADTLHAAGLVRKREGKEGHYDALRDRVIIPVTDYRGNVIGFTGRDAETQPHQKDQKVPKYQHTEGMDKSKHLFGLHLAIKGGKLTEGAYLVEGPIDVMRWHACGITNTVGIQGSDFSEDQAKLLKKFTDKLTIVPDNDCDKEKNKGIEAMHRNAPIAVKAGFTVKVLIPGI